MTAALPACLGLAPAESLPRGSNLTLDTRREGPLATDAVEELSDDACSVAL
ncbi:hypothetical protein QA634_09730 [Methylobacterium sp. CB376]|uniref:hypothetical protein n=1 Tax=unclassified Methylobacterium TaxID=2615210 RepID=UPI00143A5C85|nr:MULTISPECIES: hypothetical protein [Methylobacterium]WFT82098.1 hypothetical protein QA634_09730 [Methylobacterium nodulans]